MAQARASRVDAGSVPLDARERILSEAGRLFADRGYDAVAVVDIARASEISTGLVYYHFDDKRSLYDASVREGLALLEEGALAALQQPGSATERIRGFVGEYMHLMFEHEHLMRLLIRAVSDIEGPLSRQALSQCGAVIDAIADVIALGIEEGVFRDVEPRLAAVCLFAMASTPVTAQALRAPIRANEAPVPAEMSSFMATLFLRGIESGAEAEPGRA